MLRTKYFQIMRILMRFDLRIRVSQRYGSTCIYVIFMLGREGEIPRLKLFHYKWRWEGAFLYDARTLAFKSNERVSVCKHTNQHPGPFVLRAVIRRPVTTSAHVGFVVNKVAVRQVFLRVLWFCLLNIIPSPLRTRPSIYRWCYVTEVN